MVVHRVARGKLSRLNTPYQLQGSDIEVFEFYAQHSPISPFSLLT